MHAAGDDEPTEIRVGSVVFSARGVAKFADAERIVSFRREDVTGACVVNGSRADNPFNETIWAAEWLLTGVAGIGSAFWYWRWQLGVFGLGAAVVGAVTLRNVLGYITQLRLQGPNGAARIALDAELTDGEVGALNSRLERELSYPIRNELSYRIISPEQRKRVVVLILGSLVVVLIALIAFFFMR